MDDSENQMDQTQRALRYSFIDSRLLEVAIWNQENPSDQILDDFRGWDQEDSLNQNQQSPIDQPRERTTHTRASLAATGEIAMRAAFASQGFPSTYFSDTSQSSSLEPSTHLSSNDNLTRELSQAELIIEEHHQGLSQLLGMLRDTDGVEIPIASSIKAILGAVFVDSSHSMLAVKTVMLSLGFRFSRPEETTTAQPSEVNGLETRGNELNTAQVELSHCIDGPDCGCGCLWLHEYTSAAWR